MYYTPAMYTRIPALSLHELTNADMNTLRYDAEWKKTEHARQYLSAVEFLRIAKQHLANCCGLRYRGRAAVERLKIEPPPEINFEEFEELVRRAKSQANQPRTGMSAEGLDSLGKLKTLADEFESAVASGAATMPRLEAR